MKLGNWLVRRLLVEIGHFRAFRPLTYKRVASETVRANDTRRQSGNNPKNSSPGDFHIGIQGLGTKTKCQNDWSVFCIERPRCLSPSLIVMWACLTAALTAGCKDNLPVQFRTDETPIYHIIGNNRFIFPANYLDSISYDGALIVTTWPAMEGRTKRNFSAYQKNNIRILVSRGNEKRMGIIYRLSLLNESKECEGNAIRRTVDAQDAERAGLPPPAHKCRRTRSAPEPRGIQYGFDHSVIRYDSAKRIMGSATHSDTFVRRDGAGKFTALMRCEGEPAPPGRHPQCSFWIMYPELPDLLFEIGFSRRKNLHDVNRIEAAVRDKFLEFKSTADAEFAHNPKIRTEFEKVDRQIRNHSDAGGK